MLFFVYKVIIVLTIGDYMYEVDKINALVKQTLRQEEMIRKAQTLEESMDSIDKTISLYREFVSEAQTKFAEKLLPEDKEKLNYLTDCLEDFVELLNEQKKEFTDIQNEFRFTSEKNFDARKRIILCGNI